MREIKFRGWDGEGMIGGPIWTVAFNSSYDKRVVFHDYMIQIEVPMENVMQYTGLKDKNGTDIYEEDLVADGYGRVYKVVFKGDCWRCEPSFNKKLKNRWLSDRLEVVGNRFEGIELSKQHLIKEDINQ